LEQGGTGPSDNREDTMKYRTQQPVPMIASSCVTMEEAAQMMTLLGVRQEMEIALKRAQIAYETAVLDYAEVEQRVSRKYKLNKGDQVNAEGVITRAQ
jgi:hypothetical protein